MFYPMSIQVYEKNTVATLQKRVLDFWKFELTNSMCEKFRKAN